MNAAWPFGTDADEHDPAAYLRAQLGPNLVAQLATPVQQADAARIFQLLAGREDPHTARAWMIAMNPHLGDQTPIQAIADGRVRDVETALEAYLNGAWT